MDKGPEIDISGETTSHPIGHRNLVWLWVIGLVIFSVIIWGIAEMITVLTPHGMDRSPGP